MTLTGKLLGAAVVGGAATYLMQGDWSRRAKAKAIASTVFGWAFAAVAFYIVPSITLAPDEVKIGIVCICCGFVGYIFDRLQRVSISAEIAGVKIESEGSNTNGEKP